MAEQDNIKNPVEKQDGKQQPDEGLQRYDFVEDYNEGNEDPKGKNPPPEVKDENEDEKKKSDNADNSADNEDTNEDEKKKGEDGQGGKPDETKPNAEDDEVPGEGIFFEDDKLVFQHDKDSKTELIKIEFGEADKKQFAYVPPELKDGFLMQADYTRKMQDYKKTVETFNAEKENFKKSEKTLRAINYSRFLGQIPEKPKAEDYMEPEGRYYKDFRTNEEAREKYAEDTEKWKAKHEKYEEDYNKLIARRNEIREKNLQGLEEFAKENSEEIVQKVRDFAKEYYNPLVFEELVEYPKVVLDTVKKGLTYDEDMQKLKDEYEKKLKDATMKGKEDAVEELNKKNPVKKYISGSGKDKKSKTEQPTNISNKRYDFVSDYD